MSRTPPEGTIRPEVLAAILAIGTPGGLTTPQEALLDTATDLEWDTAHAVHAARWEAYEVDRRLWWQAFERARGRSYWRWRAVHRPWVREYGSRPVTPTGPSGP